MMLAAFLMLACSEPDAAERPPASDADPGIPPTCGTFDVDNRTPGPDPAHIIDLGETGASDIVELTMRDDNVAWVTVADDLPFLHDLSLGTTRELPQADRSPYSVTIGPDQGLWMVSALGVSRTTATGHELLFEMLGSHSFEVGSTDDAVYLQTDSALHRIDDTLVELRSDGGTLAAGGAHVAVWEAGRVVVLERDELISSYPLDDVANPIVSVGRAVYAGTITVDPDAELEFFVRAFDERCDAVQWPLAQLSLDTYPAEMVGLETGLALLHDRNVWFLRFSDGAVLTMPVDDGSPVAIAGDGTRLIVAQWHELLVFDLAD